MKRIFLLAFFLIALQQLNAQSFTTDIVSSTGISTDINNYTVSASYDTVYARTFNVSLASLNGIASLRMELVQTDDAAPTLKDSIYSLPADNSTASSVYSLSRSGNSFSIPLGNLHLMNRYRLRFFTVDAGNVQEKIVELEF